MATTIPLPTGQLIRSSFEQMQLKTGTLEPFLSLPFDLYGPLTTNFWISHVWEYLSKQKITLQPGASLSQLWHAQKAWTTEPTCQGLPKGTTSDHFLMPLFTKASYKKDGLYSLNICLMYLQTVTLSNIATADRIYVTHTA
jgi:hypothetical protein